FLNADVAELDRRSFGFEREIALTIIAVLAAGDFLAIYAQTEDAVGADDAVMVPFGRALAAIFGGEAAVPAMPAKRFHRRAVNREHITVRGEPIGLLAVLLLVVLGVAVIEHLHFDAPQERHSGRGDGRAPDEHARISTPAQMSPFHLQDEILVLPRRAQRAGGPARAVDDSLAHAPGFW